MNIIDKKNEHSDVDNASDDNEEDKEDDGDEDDDDDDDNENDDNDEDNENEAEGSEKEKKRKESGEEKKMNCIYSDDYNRENGNDSDIEEGDIYENEEDEDEDEEEEEEEDTWVDSSYYNGQFHEQHMKNMREYDHQSNINDELYNTYRRTYGSSKFKRGIHGGHTKNRELTEKEKMAAALFSGITPNSGFINNASTNKLHMTKNKEKHLNSSESNKIKKVNNSYLKRKQVFSHLEKPKLNLEQKGNVEKVNFHSKEHNLIDHVEDKKRDIAFVENNSNSKDFMKSNMSDTVKNKYGCYDMLELNESIQTMPQGTQGLLGNEKNTCESKDIKCQKKAVFLNTHKVNIQEIVQKIENALNARIIEMSNDVATACCQFSHCKVFIHLKVDNKKIVASVKSTQNTIVDGVLDNLRNLFVS